MDSRNVSTWPYIEERSREIEIGQLHYELRTWVRKKDTKDGKWYLTLMFESYVIDTALNQKDVNKEYRIMYGRINYNAFMWLTHGIIIPDQDDIYGKRWHMLDEYQEDEQKRMPIFRVEEHPNRLVGYGTEREANTNNQRSENDS